MTVRELLETVRVQLGLAATTDRRDLELLTYLRQFRDEVYARIRRWEIDTPAFPRSTVTASSSPTSYPDDYLATSAVLSDDDQQLTPVPYPLFTALTSNTELATCYALGPDGWYLGTTPATIYYWPQLSDIQLSDTWPALLITPAIYYLIKRVGLRDRQARYDLSLEVLEAERGLLEAVNMGTRGVQTFSIPSWNALTTRTP